MSMGKPNVAMMSLVISMRGDEPVSSAPTATESIGIKLA